MITLVPALVWGFSDRGLVREGMAADINVFDPETIAPAVPRIVNDLPARRNRLLQRSVGFKATLVNGAVTILDDEPTGAMPGSLLRNPLARV
jgi:N-acyl-D-aspartate/D-glutamate deacylase